MRLPLVAISVFWSCFSWALPDEWIFLHGFESEVSISFEGDQSTVFTEAAEEHQFAVRVEDLDENIVIGRPVLWYLQGAAPLTVIASQDTVATIQAESFAVASAQLYVIDTGSGASATASLMMAELAVGAHYLDSSAIVSGGTPQSGVGDVVLVASAEAAQLEVGDVLVSGDQVGLLVRIVGVPQSKGETVTLSVEPAKITDAFEALSVTARSSAESRSYRLSDNVSRGQKALSDDLDCETGGENAVGFEISQPSIDLTFNVTTQVELDIAASTVERFSLAAVAEAGMAANSGSLSYTSNITGKVTCTFQLPEIFTPPVPVSAFSFQLNTAPTIGIEFEAGFSGPSFNIAGPSGSISGSAKAGLQYASQAGWSPLSELNWSGGFQPLTADFDASITFTLKGGPFVANEFGLVANLGQPPLGVQLADLRFIRLKALGELDFQLATPLNPERKDYVGPQWDIDAIITGQYQAALADGLLFSLLDALDLPTQIDALTGDIFDPIEIRIAEAPKPQVSISCLPSCPLNPNNGDMARLTMTAAGTGSGLSTFVAARDGNTFTQELASGSFVAGQGAASWTPTVADEGAYEVFPRLVSDALSQLFPYGGVQGQMLNVNTIDLPVVYQGTTDSIDINATGQLAFVASRSGCNGAKAVFLNGSIYACAPPQTWFINSNNDIRLTNAGTVYFDVLQWSHGGELLQGIFKGPNPGGSSGQCWSGDTVVAGPRDVNSTLGYFIQDAADNGDVAWIERRNLTFGGQVVTVGIQTSESCEGFDVRTGNPRDVRITSDRTVVVSTRDQVLAWEYPPDGWIEESRRAKSSKEESFQPPPTILLDEDHYIGPAPFDSIRAMDMNDSGTVGFILCWEEESGDEGCDVGTVNQSGSITLVDRVPEEEGDVNEVRISAQGEVAYCKEIDGEWAIFTSANVFDPFVADGQEIGPNHLVRDVDCGQFDLGPNGLVFRAVAYEKDDYFATIRGLFRISESLLFPGELGSGELGSE